jgi:hypothetical protein
MDYRTSERKHYASQRRIFESQAFSTYLSRKATGISTMDPPDASAARRECAQWYVRTSTKV